MLTWHCIESLNCFLLLRNTPRSTYGHRQRYLAPVLSPFVHASHRQWHCVSLSATVCQRMCSCKINNLIYFTSLQIRLGTAKTLPPNTNLILQAMANSLQTGTLLSLADSYIEVKVKTSIYFSSH